MAKALSNLWAREPVVITLVGSAAFWPALFELFASFGHPFTDPQQHAIVMFVGVLAAVGILRANVTPNESAEQTVSNATRSTLPALFIALALVSAVSCASLSLKQNAVISLQASETALESAHDAERLLCSPTADQTQAITHCDGAGAQALGLTDAKHQQPARLFSTAFGAEAIAANALTVWRAGDHAPSNVADYQKDLDDILALVQQTFPATHVTVTKAQAAVDEAAKIAVILGVK
jgi:hypothetical protein